jgi:hypothetical protein
MEYFNGHGEGGKCREVGQRFHKIRSRAENDMRAELQGCLCRLRPCPSKIFFKPKFNSIQMLKVVIDSTMTFGDDGYKVFMMRVYKGKDRKVLQTMINRIDYGTQGNFFSV